MQQKEVLLISDPGVDNATGFGDAIVATSYETKDVVRIDPAKPDQRSVLATGLDYPLGLASESGNLYVGDFLAGQILQVAANGVKLDPPKLVAKGLQGPEGLALTGDGRLLVVESGADRLPWSICPAGRSLRSRRTSASSATSRIPGRSITSSTA